MSSFKSFNIAIEIIIASWFMIMLLKAKQHGIPMTEMEFFLPILITIPTVLAVELIINHSKIKRGKPASKN